MIDLITYFRTEIDRIVHGNLHLFSNCATVLRYLHRYERP